MARVNKQKLKKLLDEVFSHYIRLKYADEFGMSRCWTCGKTDHYSRLYNGHFASRRYAATRWDERNCRPQCYACNILRHGEQWLFGYKLDREYGENTAFRIFSDAQNGPTWSTAERLDMARHYRTALSHEITRLQLRNSTVTERTIAVVSKVDRYTDKIELGKCPTKTIRIDEK